jgi:hypothetical protein
MSAVVTGLTGRQKMATIVVKDLNQSVELDRKAMRVITGGRSGSNLGMSRHHSGLFQKPLSFSEFKPLSFDFSIKQV